MKHSKQKIVPQVVGQLQNIHSKYLHYNFLTNSVADLT